MKRAFSWLWAAIVILSGMARGTNLPFLQDDFAKARSEAVQRKLPIFVEIWAPW